MSKCDRFQVGDTASMRAVATEATVNALADISGDRNPVHLNEEYAKTTIFKTRIAHGLFCLGMVSNLLGTELPGTGTVLVSETVNYKRPVYLNDEIETTVRVEQILPKDKMEFSFRCVNTRSDVCVMDGTVIVKVC